MGSLLTSLLNSTGALRAYSRAFNVIQNNITNASTPGYVKQDQVLISLPFNPAEGLSGGVLAGPMRNARSGFLEQTVRDQQEYLGGSLQRAENLQQVENLFDLSSEFGIAGSMSAFFNGFSALAVNPNDTAARRNILERAADVTRAFQQTASGLQQVAANITSQTRDAAAEINRIAAQIAALNSRYRSGQASQDAGLDAQLHAALEELSELANFTLIRTEDGAANVYLGGQTILVVGEHSYDIQADFSSTQTVIRDAQGKDITSQITGGRLAAMLEGTNSTLPGYLADLNVLAVGFADAVNTALAAGVDQNGQPPVTDLFTYDAARGAALTLGMNALAPDKIAAALAAAPGGNGNAIALSQLGSAPVLGGSTFVQFYGNLSGRVGRDVADAMEQRAQYRDTAAQARQLRAEASGVSLDEEAAKLLQFEQAYQAVGKLVGVLDELTMTVINMIR
jgi:flagellar hook-associated protein 1 FlgK